MGADYSFEVKNFEIWAPAFFKHNNSSIATVPRKDAICQTITAANKVWRPKAILPNLLSLMEKTALFIHIINVSTLFIIYWSNYDID